LGIQREKELSIGLLNIEEDEWRRRVQVEE